MQSGDATLTQQVRALYEGGVVPVREVAALAGVSERTLYKYAQKGGWAARVTRRSGDGRPHTSNGPAQRTARGAGGRFIPLADAGKPHARGIKALDPEGARQAAERCMRAAVLSQAAETAAAAAHTRAARERVERAAQAQMRAQVRTYEVLAGALVELGRIVAGSQTPAASASRAEPRPAWEQHGGFVMTKRGREWLLPHERAADATGARPVGGSALRMAVSARAFGLAARLQAAILTQMERLVQPAVPAAATGSVRSTSCEQAG